MSIPIRIARREGDLVDLGCGGARVRHVGPLKLGATVDLAFVVGNVRFAHTARVVACRVASLSSNGSPTTYESSLSFAGNADAEHTIASILNGDGSEMT